MSRIKRNRQQKQKQWIYIIVATVFGVSLLGYKAYTTLIPMAAESIAKEIPESIYKSIGQSTLESFDKSEFSDSELPNEIQDKVKKNFAELLNKLALDNEKYKLHFRDWTQGSNAFALMDGSIVVTDQLVLTLDEEAQLAGVLLHEIAHIQNHHQMENTIRVSIFYITLSLIFGDIGVVSDLLIETSTIGINLNYSKEFELESDRYAAQKMLQLYDSVTPMITALEKLHEQEQALDVWTEQDDSAEQADSTKQPDSDEINPNDQKPDVKEQEKKNIINSWFSTHPPLQERIEAIKSVTQQAP